jgi:hypothetical protein
MTNPGKLRFHVKIVAHRELPGQSVMVYHHANVFQRRLAFLLNRYGPQARAIIEERLTFWVTLAAVVLVVGIVAALYLF